MFLFSCSISMISSVNFENFFLSTFSLIECHFLFSIVFPSNCLYSIGQVSSGIMIRLTREGFNKGFNKYPNTELGWEE